jgi:hypothetical protein
VYSSVAAIRAGRFPTRYVRPSARYREARLGLRRSDATRAAHVRRDAPVSLASLRRTRLMRVVPALAGPRRGRGGWTRVLWSSRAAQARRPSVVGATWRD